MKSHGRQVSVINDTILRRIKVEMTSNCMTLTPNFMKNCLVFPQGLRGNEGSYMEARTDIQVIVTKPNFVYSDNINININNRSQYVKNNIQETRILGLTN
jgi:hypothetical protein